MLMNGSLETWQVVKLLTRHPTWTAEAPETENQFESRVHTSVMNTFEFEYLVDGIWEADDQPYQRSDWTIRNEHNRIIRFKPRVKKVGMACCDELEAGGRMDEGSPLSGVDR